MLFEYQKEGVEKSLDFLNSIGAVYNASEQGTGKSLMTIETIKRLKSKRILIVCPALVKYNWASEISKWSLEGSIFTVNSSSQILKYSNERFIIINYDLLVGCLPYLSLLQFDLVVYDEAHMMKTPEAKRTKAGLALVSPKRIFLSGTPFTKALSDIFSVTKVVLRDTVYAHSKVFQDFTTFSYRYCIPTTIFIRGKRVTKFSGGKNKEELRAILFKNFMFRYTKKQVLPELGEKRFIKIDLPPKLALENTKGSLIDYSALNMDLDKLSSGDSNLPELATHRRLQSLLKLEATISFIKDHLEGGKPLVVFGIHSEFLMKLRDAFPGCSFITGQTPANMRGQEVEKFMSGQTDLFIGNMVAAGIGINLVRADTMLLAELDWSPSVVGQAIDRIHRIGADTSGVNIYYLSVKNSIDERVYNVITSKLRTFNEILNKKEK